MIIDGICVETADELQGSGFPAANYGYRFCDVPLPPLCRIPFIRVTLEFKILHMPKPSAFQRFSGCDIVNMDYTT